MGECENEHSHSQMNFHYGELESWWTPEILESDCKGQNPSPYGVLCIIGKLLNVDVQNGLA